MRKTKKEAAGKQVCKENEGLEAEVRKMTKMKRGAAKAPKAAARVRDLPALNQLFKMLH